MKRLVIGLLAACAWSLSILPAQAQNDAPSTPGVVISSGLEGGGYWKTGNRLQSVAREAGLDIVNQASVGSLDNLKKLLASDSPVNLAFAQADALQYFLNENPGAAPAVETLQSVGEECVFIISSDDSDIRTDEDMQESPRLYLGIKSSKSGIWVTFNYMKSLVPELRQTTLMYGDTVQMMTDLAHPKSDMDEAVMVVHGSNEHSPEIDMVIADPDRFRFVKITDERLTKTLPDGKAVYHRKKVAPGALESAGAVETICVQGLLLANKNKLTASQRSTLVELIKSRWSQVHATNQKP
jgi:TRAP-type uncharacterized transport system substrate-binding protein